MAIKKAFTVLHGILLANQDKKVKTIMDELTEAMSAKGAGGAATAVFRNEAGEVVAILDYYFKKWLPISHVEYGSKANSTSGLNTMCKLGTSLWTKQQRDFKVDKLGLLNLVAAGEIQPTDIQGRLDELEIVRRNITPYPITGLAFDTVEELVAATETFDDVVAEYQAEVEAAELAEAEAAELAAAEAEKAEAEAKAAAEQSEAA